MRKFTLLLSLLLCGIIVFAQPAGYYNGTAGKKGTALKAALHEIINDHVNYSYSQAKYLINYSDADPNNPNNVILFYTQRSSDADNYGTGGDKINREHVWAKSHGDFSNVRPMDGDAYNLRPADASVNTDKSNFDFGIVQPGGTQHPEATTCWYDNSQRVWEPGPATKGQVARILLYMSTRYEGTNGEMDLEAVNGYGTSPKPEHGDLQALLQWHRDYPPSDFERRRNHRIFEKQRNRNPFVDHPEFVDMIWGDAEPKAIAFDECSMNPLFPAKNESTTIRVKIEASATITDVKLFWGDAYNAEDESVTMNADGSYYSGVLSIEDFNDDDVVYYKIVATTSEGSESWHESYVVPRKIEAGDLTSIAQIQGTGSQSPIKDQKVTVAGRVMANLDNIIYIQDGTNPNSGLGIFAPDVTGYRGDSLIITGKVTEYNNLTQLESVEYAYNFGNNKVYEPKQITVSQIGEEYEGMLVQMKNVTFNQGGSMILPNNKSFTFTDGTGTSTIYSKYDSRLINTTLPAGVINLTGILSQYQSNYQLLVRDVEDMTNGVDNDPPGILEVKPTAVDWIEVTFDEMVDKTSSEVTTNYVFNHNIQTVASYRYSEGNAVLLQVSGMTDGTHTLTISGVEDLRGNAMQNVSKEFNSTFNSIRNLSSKTTRVYPNPIAYQQLLNMEGTERILTAELYSYSGKLMMIKEINDFSGSMNIHLNSGLYILKLNKKNSTEIHKVRIQ